MATNICKTCGKTFQHKCHAPRKYCSLDCQKNGDWLKEMKKLHLGQKAWNKGKPAPWANWKVLMTKESREKMALAKKGKVSSFKGKFHSEESKVKNRLAHLGKKLSKETIRKCLKRREMSNLEIKVQKVIDKNNLPYKFTGNGSFFIERKNPDFVNTNGEKKALEVYYKRHKDEFRDGGEEGWKKNRLLLFNKYGWDIIFLEGTGLTEPTILKALKGGC